MTPTAPTHPAFSTLAHERSVDRRPHCVLVTGPRGAGMTQWVDECVGRLIQRHPASRCGVLLADQSPVRKATACANKPGVVVRGCFLPCTCCPAAADLPAAVHGLVAANQPNWIFIEIPVIAAPGLIAEFDRMVRWPRSLIVCLTPAWARARRMGSLSPFQSLLLETADVTISNDEEANAAMARVLPTGDIARNFPGSRPRDAGLSGRIHPVCHRS
jgi:hypothetical protein